MLLRLLLLFVLSVGSAGSLARAENIKIGLPSVTITAMPFFVAKEHGFFQQEGLNAEMVVMPASLNIKVLLAGDIQYAATMGSAVAAAIRGINVRIVMLFVDRPLQDLVGAASIASIADLKGKTVAISSRGGLQDIIMRRILTQSKVDLNSVNVITIPGQTAMISRAQDQPRRRGHAQPAVSIFSPIAKDSTTWASRATSCGCRAPAWRLWARHWNVSPDQVRRLTRALARARTFAKENKAKVFPLLKRVLRIDDEDLLSKIYEQHKQVETADGRVDAQLMADTIRDARQTENITKEIPASQVFDFSYLPAR